MASVDDIARWRAEAKALRAAVVAGDEAALGRVLAAHPKYVDRPLERLRTNRIRFSLNDAQLTIARENGSDSWSMLCDQGRRWPHRTIGPQQGRAMRIAAERSDGHCGPEHLLLALAAPSRPSIASAVLDHVGADLTIFDNRPAMPHESGRKQTSSNPAFSMCVSCAATFAIAQGADRVTDEHVLLALVYLDPDLLVIVNADPDEIYDALAERGVTVPPVRPSPNRPTRGPYNPKLIVHRDDLNAVIKVLRAKHPPGSEHWGLNYSKDDPSEGYIISEDDIDIEAIAREALGAEGRYRIESFPAPEGADQ